MTPKKRYNPDPQAYDDDLPEVDPFDDFDTEPDYDHSEEEMIEERGFEADPYSML